MNTMPGLKHLLERLGVHVLAEHVRSVGDEVDAVRVDRARLHALLAEELAGARGSLSTGLPGLISAAIFSNPGSAISSQKRFTMSVGGPMQIGEPICAV